MARVNVIMTVVFLADSQNQILLNQNRCQILPLLTSDDICQSQFNVGPGGCKQKLKHHFVNLRRSFFLAKVCPGFFFERGGGVKWFKTRAR